jgi:hypothetical protein
MIKDDHEEFVSLAVLQLEVAKLSADVIALTKATSALVDAWNAAGKVVTFIKWASTLVTALGILWLFAKNVWNN